MKNKKGNVAVIAAIIAIIAVTAGIIGWKFAKKSPAQPAAVSQLTVQTQLAPTEQQQGKISQKDVSNPENLNGEGKIFLDQADFVKDSANIYTEKNTGIKLYLSTEDWPFYDVGYPLSENKKSEINQVFEGLSLAFKKYPISLLKNNLSRIYLMNDVKMDGFTIGGTLDLSTKSILMVAENGKWEKKLEFNKNGIESTFHHEFAHVLSQKYGFFNDGNLIDRWNKFIPKDFSYGAGSYNFIVNDLSQISEDINQRCKDGFLSEYAKADEVEDFAVIAESMFSREDSISFWKDDYMQCKKVKGKTDVVIDFYKSLDPVFTNAYFKKWSDIGFN